MNECCCGNVFSLICLCVCVLSVCDAPAFESLDLESSFLICGHILEYLGQGHLVRVKVTGTSVCAVCG